jgi:hypothetical protein
MRIPAPLVVTTAAATLLARPSAQPVFTIERTMREPGLQKKLLLHH